MLEPRSALAAHLRPGRYGVNAGPAGVSLGERPLRTLLQLSGWPGSFEEAGARVLGQIGLPGIGDFRRAQGSGGALSFRIAPERVLVRLAAGAALPPTDPMVTPVLDLSHSRTVIRIAGPNAADLLARALPIDLHESVFPPGTFVQSGMHSTGVLLHRLPNEANGLLYELCVPRSYAVTIWDFLTESAAPFGCSVEAPVR